MVCNLSLKWVINNYPKDRSYVLTGTISPEMTQMAINVAIAQKGKELIEQQGEAAVELIQSANVINPPPQATHSPPGIGSLIDTYI